jgi:adenylate cyclase
MRRFNFSRQSFRPLSLKVGLVTIMSCCLLYGLFRDNQPRWLNALDAQITDAMFRLRGAEATTGSVIMVGIDEASLRKYGQWPWPRDLMAKLTANIYEGKPAAVGFDILFAEKDRTSPSYFLEAHKEIFEPFAAKTIHSLASSLLANLDHDRVFGATLTKGPAVLGYFFGFSGSPMGQDYASPPSPFASDNHSSQPSLPLSLLQANSAISNIPELTGTVPEGFLNIFPDANDTVRSAPLCIGMATKLFPSFDFEMVRTGLTADMPRLVYNNANDPSLIESTAIKLGSRLFTTNDEGRIVVNFRGPATTFLILSAADILEGHDLELLKDKYVLVGSVATGITDTFFTPFPGQMSGLEIHANILDNLLAEDYFRPLTLKVNPVYLTICFAGLFMVVILATVNQLSGWLLGITLCFAIVWGNYQLFFLRQLFIGPSYVVLSLGAIVFAVSLTNYFTEGRRKNFVRRAFSRYVSPWVVSELLKDPEKLKLSVESKEVTVLFSDIRNFSTISEKMAPADLGNFLNKYMSLMTEIIISHHGMVDKFIGDGIMAVWGTPLDDPNHAENAVRAALAMVTLIESQPEELKINGQGFEIGIGLNSGKVSAGHFGSTSRFTYTVIGDNVNLASRLEDLNKYYSTKALLSGITHELLNATIPCRFIGRVTVKGRDRKSVV